MVHKGRVPTKDLNFFQKRGGSTPKLLFFKSVYTVKRGFLKLLSKSQHFEGEGGVNANLEKGDSLNFYFLAVFPNMLKNIYIY